MEKNNYIKLAGNFYPHIINVVETWYNDKLK
jgi:hypothetical protein